MKKKLLTLMFVVAISFLVTSSLVAATKVHNSNFYLLNNRLTQIKSNISTSKGKKIDLMFQEMMNKCNTTLAWTCQQAMDHVTVVSYEVQMDCENYGWESEYCGELTNWLIDTGNWADRICAGENARLFYDLKRRRPEKIIIHSQEKNKAIDTSESAR
ncbi:MAG TPA: hypothetical protein PKY82_20260 [Pyrinomonadaceae bacterium]|nr:hypothetical protein [Pyrinomonadaceae bacterium]